MSVSVNPTPRRWLLLVAATLVLILTAGVPMAWAKCLGANWTMSLRSSSPEGAAIGASDVAWPADGTITQVHETTFRIQIDDGISIEVQHEL